MATLSTVNLKDITITCCVTLARLSAQNFFIRIILSYKLKTTPYMLILPQNLRTNKAENLHQHNFCCRVA